MSKASVLRMYAREAECTATRTGRADYRRVARDLADLADKARAETARKRKLRARKACPAGSGRDLADREEFADAGGQVDLVGYLECMSRTATRDTGPEFTGTGPQSKRTLRRSHAAK